MANLRDGLGGEEVNQSGTDTTIVQAVSGVFTSAFNTDGQLQSIAIGSPYTYGNKLVAGSDVLTAGSNAWIVFPTAFASTPQTIIATDTETAEQALLVVLGSINTGSFYIEGPTAADTFNWMAVGL